jgi:hypothetical protein
VWIALAVARRGQADVVSETRTFFRWAGRQRLWLSSGSWRCSRSSSGATVRALGCR